MKNVAVLLNGGIINDARVIKTINSISKIINGHIDLYYFFPTNKDNTIFNNANIHLFPLKYKNNILSKIIRHTLFFNEFLYLAKHIKLSGKNYHYIYANDLPCLKPALALKKFFNCKLIYDSHEIYCETINQFFPAKTNMFKSFFFKTLIGFMKWIGKRKEKKWIKYVDTFITVGQGLKNYFETQYNYSEIKILMNFPSKHSTSVTPINLKVQLNLKESSFLLIYQGNLNNGRGLHYILESMNWVNENVYLIVLGDGVLRDELKSVALNNKLENRIFFINAVPQKELLSYTKGADCGISLLESINLSKKLAAPNKIFEYINAGIPVIANKSFETDIVFNKYQIGMLSDLNSKEIANIINKMSAADLSIYKTNCSLAAQEYNWEQQEPILFDILNEI